MATDWLRFSGHGPELAEESVMSAKQVKRVMSPERQKFLAHDYARHANAVRPLEMLRDAAIMLRASWNAKHGVKPAQMIRKQSPLEIA